jgi:hypothetical protein
MKVSDDRFQRSPVLDGATAQTEKVSISEDAYSPNVRRDKEEATTYKDKVVWGAQ